MNMKSIMSNGSVRSIIMIIMIYSIDIRTAIAIRIIDTTTIATTTTTSTITKTTINKNDNYPSSRNDYHPIRQNDHRVTQDVDSPCSPILKNITCPTTSFSCVYDPDDGANGVCDNYAWMQFPIEYGCPNATYLACYTESIACSQGGTEVSYTTYMDNSFVDEQQRNTVNITVIGSCDPNTPPNICTGPFLNERICPTTDETCYCDSDIGYLDLQTDCTNYAYCTRTKDSESKTEYNCCTTDGAVVYAGIHNNIRAETKIEILRSSTETCDPTNIADICSNPSVSRTCPTTNSTCYHDFDDGYLDLQSGVCTNYAYCVLTNEIPFDKNEYSCCTVDGMIIYAEIQTDPNANSIYIKLYNSTNVCDPENVPVVQKNAPSVSPTISLTMEPTYLIISTTTKSTKSKSLTIVISIIGVLGVFVCTFLLRYLYQSNTKCAKYMQRCWTCWKCYDTHFYRKDNINDDTNDENNIQVDVNVNVDTTEEIVNDDDTNRNITEEIDEDVDIRNIRFQATSPDNQTVVESNDRNGEAIPNVARSNDTIVPPSQRHAIVSPCTARMVPDTLMQVQYKDQARSIQNIERSNESIIPPSQQRNINVSPNATTPMVLDTLMPVQYKDQAQTVIPMAIGTLVNSDDGDIPLVTVALDTSTS